MLNRFPSIRQPNEMDCGPVCLRIVLLYYKVWSKLNDIRQLCNTTREGTTMLNLRKAAEEVGFHAYGVAVNYDMLLDEVHLPAILHWMDRHFVVVYKVRRNKVYISDPARGLVVYNKEEFQKNCMSSNGQCSVLILEPTPKIQSYHTEKTSSLTTLSLFSKYVRDHRKLLIQLFIGLIAGLFFQILFPFLTQSIIDVGIQNKDINFVLLILTIQLFFLFSRFGIEAIRKWILLHLSSKINISMLSGFFIKLMNLPLSYYDSRKTGDTLQRVNDNYRIQNLVTLSALNTLFSVISLIVLGSVLFYYSALIFLVFFCWDRFLRNMDNALFEKKEKI
ncbi:cysteine peptidase family C39 domain-containing protein [Olivibacter sp. 47]|uniref:cysteine peptidase family C39 domain-containing protein n=1 Tax=Olivibacter sp. 47 TaxID=3056486 RepID=UPI0025A4781B|nr:cysteine peptidase family C39 domain-containing protein [Olivibacter sp. 47]MDM8173647.1 cysteine peptidase family C39 domain-containing protein [Olivibacter sp. 47]